MKQFNQMTPEEKRKALQDAMAKATGGDNPNDPMNRGPIRDTSGRGWDIPITPPKPDPERVANEQIDRAVAGRGQSAQPSPAELNDFEKIFAPSPPSPSLLQQLNAQPGEVAIENPEAPSEDEQARASRLQWLQQKRLQGQ